MLVLQSLFASLVAAAAIPEKVLSVGRASSGSGGAVACEQARCSDIGRKILLSGGNAADSLIATVLCVGVMAPYHTGIGGGGFALIRDKDGQYEAVDFRETAPAAAFENMYEGNVEGSVHSGLAVAIPGELRGLEYIHRKYSKLPWKALVAPAIDVARNGFKVSEDTLRYMEGFDFLREDPVWAEQWAPNGTLVGLGDTLYRKAYADTLEKIAEQGVDIFYTGSLAESMISVIQAANGTMTLSDLENYKVVTGEALSTTYRGHTLYTTGIPSSGAVGISILKTMEQYPIEDWSDVNLSVHRLSEAMRFAYGARLELGDPDFVSGAKAIEEILLSEETARRTSQLILDDRTQPVNVYDPRGVYVPDNHGTSHFSTVDADGMTTACTSTVNTLFGSQVMDPATGIILNNEMNDFSIPGVRNEFGFEPSEANYIRPGKRPLSSITPFIISSPDSLFSIGAAGGSRIISSTAQAIWHLLEHNMTLAQSLSEPRLHDQLIPNRVTFEYAFDNGTVQSMAERGHEVAWVKEGQSALQGVGYQRGRFEAVGEPRQKSSGGSIA
ncbi:related to gamma-glutamyltransferase [Cephalotrichum gorgonifer]|uniref:Glutathione hydrolase n=1 Tax=Cephalotrichum gorgonifer TaxID=2041049 RepID=A0AAE8N355_9PEZI|nr:related to gamma-glutamyltransferase [Cephalotrichum gorgonifer]